MDNVQVRDDQGKAMGRDKDKEKPVIPGDINHDGCVDMADVAILVSAFGTRFGDPGFVKDADLNGDGLVNIQDFNILHNNWGKGCKPKPDQP